MISPVSPGSVVLQTLNALNAEQARPQPAPSSDQQDSVQLSPQAQAAGDVDHDGDSH